MRSGRKQNSLSNQEMMIRSRQDLVRLVARLTRAGLDSESIKLWFVEGIPNAMSVVAQRELQHRRSSLHNAKAQAAPNTTE